MDAVVAAFLRLIHGCDRAAGAGRRNVASGVELQIDLAVALVTGDPRVSALLDQDSPSLRG